MPTDRTNTERQRAYRQRQREARSAALVAGAPAAPAIPTMPGTARWKVLHEQARAALETIAQEMEAYRDERSEQWQESDRADEFEEKLTDVQAAFDAVDAVSL